MAVALMEGEEILTELSGLSALVLWQAHRDVLLWVAERPETRPALFALGALARREALLELSGLEGTARDAVASLGMLMHPVGNECEQALDVSRYCRILADWAASIGAAGTAVAFARSAAEACPEDAAPALHVGRVAARFDRRTMARTWFGRAIALARIQGDWASYAGAYVELGRAAMRVGADARPFFVRAFRVARRNCVPTIRGDAHHGLSRIESAAGNLEEAEKHLKRALRAYGKDDSAFEVRHDLAALLLRRGGGANCRVAVGIIARLLPLRDTWPERIETLTLMVRAAAGADEPVLLESAWYEAVAAIGLLGDTPQAARCLMELARATAEAQEWRRADELTKRAEQLALRINAADVTAELGAFLREAWRRRPGQIGKSRRGSRAT